MFLWQLWQLKAYTRLLGIIGVANLFIQLLGICVTIVCFAKVVLFFKLLIMYIYGLNHLQLTLLLINLWTSLPLYLC